MNGNPINGKKPTRHVRHHESGHAVIAISECRPGLRQQPGFNFVEAHPGPPGKGNGRAGMSNNKSQVARQIVSRRGWRVKSHKHSGMQIFDENGRLLGFSMTPEEVISYCKEHGGATKRGRAKGYKVSEETRAKMLVHLMQLAEARRGKPGNHHSPETSASIGRKVSIALTGRKLSPEHCAAISRASKGKPKPMSPSHRAAVVAANRGRAPTPAMIAAAIANGRENWRHMHTPEAIAKREARIGVPLSKEQKAKISAAMTGRKLTPEHVAAMRAALKGRKLSPEHVAAMRAGMWSLPPDIERIVREVAEEFNINNKDDEDGGAC